ncbi:hypothetical protein L6164_012726 [Bauhinia variegata]|uniref:Uncharacterized protein n=1 Tax=Bauhinia variegata TaxID=167791 RepID=A0ACB9PCH1_BAUVA|nr:hypothetical protein L6164_012726 [Bauhinia variegata]
MLVMEHITTVDAVKFIESCKEGYVRATVTPQRLLLNRNSLFQGGLQLSSLKFKESVLSSREKSRKKFLNH